MGQRTMARILQENSRAGQRLCLKGATWVGTVTAPHDKEVQAGHQGHTECLEDSSYSFADCASLCRGLKSLTTVYPAPNLGTWTRRAAP